MGPQERPGKAQEAAGRPREPPRGENGAQERPKNGPRRQQEALNKPKEAPSKPRADSLHHRGGTGKRARAARTGKRARAARERRPHPRPRKRERFTTRPPHHDTARDLPLPRHHQTTENARDLPRDHQTPRTPRQMYLFRRSTGARKTREIYRWATRQTRQPRRPTDAPTAFSDSAFRFLSRQVTESGRSARLKLHSGRESDK